jgi:hypothetical protein
MANEELVAQYNQVLWQLGQLHEEAKIAGEGYQSKLRAIRKRSDKLNEQLHRLGAMLRKQHALALPPIGASSTGGNSFQPTATVGSSNMPWDPSNMNG